MCLDQKASLMILVGFNYIPTTIKFDLEFKNANTFYIQAKRGLSDVQSLGFMIVALHKIDSQMGFAFQKKKALRSVANTFVGKRLKSLLPVDINLPDQNFVVAGAAESMPTQTLTL